MSEAVVAPSVPAVSPQAEAAANAAVKQSGIKEGDITGEQAKAMVEAEKAAKLAGKPVPGKEPKGDLLKEAAQEAIRKHKLKVDGEEIEVDEEELKRGYSHQRAANKILQEGKLARKQAEEFISMMKDPEKFYDTAKKLGHDPRLLSEKYLASQLEDELMDPRDKELRDAKTKLKQIEDMERMQKEQVEKQRNEALKAKFAKDYSDQFVAALQESGLPPTKPMVAEMAKYIARSAEIGFKMTAAEAAQLVKEDVQQSYQRLVGGLEGDTLLKLLGEDVANKLRKADTSRLKNPEANLRTPEQQGERKVRSESNRPMTRAEWRAHTRG